MPPESELHPDDTINIASLEVQKTGSTHRLKRGSWTLASQLSKGSELSKGSKRKKPTTFYSFGMVRPSKKDEIEVEIEVPRSEGHQNSGTTDGRAHQDPVTEANLSLIHVKTGGGRVKTGKGTYLKPVVLAAENMPTAPEGRELIHYGIPGSGSAQFTISVPKRLKSQ